MLKKMKDLFNLNGKVVVITGAAGLLGEQHANAVAEYGGIPILLDVQEESVKKLAKKLNDQYDINALGYKVNITNEEEVKNNCEEILSEFGQIDALINNAANNPKMINQSDENFSRLENFLLNDWEADINVGLTGAFLCSKFYGSAISKNQAGGVIINISSDLGIIAPDQRLYNYKNLKRKDQVVKPDTYSVVKTGLLGLTRYLATYWPENVRCNALCPGGVNKDLPAELVKKVIEVIPMKRMATPDEYQGALIFLLSDASKYMNGAILSIDGGRTAW